MPEETEKLLHFTDNVLKSAAQENQELNQRLEDKRKAALHAAQMAARESAQAYYDREAAKIRSEAGREISRHLMDGKRQVYLRRSEISKEVMAQVRQKLDQFVTSKEYPEHLKMMLADAMEQLPGVEEITLRLRKEDLPLGPMLAKSAAPVKVVCEEGRFHIGGLAVRCPQLGVRIDCSFDAQLEELSGHFAETFGLSLSDELDEG
jgi:vacuolar-type H+-ATPase subunit E/Vma4